VSENQGSVVIEYQGKYHIKLGRDWVLSPMRPEVTMRSERQSDMQTPFGVPVEGTVINDVAMVQQAFGVSLSYQDIAARERLAALCARFPLLAGWR
jgi:hypothetical protein